MFEDHTSVTTMAMTAMQKTGSSTRDKAGCKSPQHGLELLGVNSMSQEWWRAANLLPFAQLRLLICRSVDQAEDGSEKGWSCEIVAVSAIAVKSNRGVPASGGRAAELTSLLRSSVLHSRSSLPFDWRCRHR